MKEERSGRLETKENMTSIKKKEQMIKESSWCKNLSRIEK